MPYSIDKKLGGDNETNVKYVENCVNDIKGNNKRTGKPYTKSEKIAICKTSLKKHKAKSSENNDYAEACEEVEYAVQTFATKLIKGGRARSPEDAYYLTQVYLERCNHDIELLRMIQIK